MLLVALSALCLSASAQITITNGTFPSAGDTLRYAIDDAPQGIDVVPTAGVTNFTWDFTGLKPAQFSETTFKNASTGINVAKFPGADLVVVGQTGENYFNKTATNFESMGYAGADPAGLGLQVLAKYSPVLLERKAPLNFFDVQGPQTTNLTLPFSAKQLPDSLFQGLPVKPDSIRIRFKTDRFSIVDGWGNCKIPGGSYPVLRQKRTEYSETALDVKFPFIGWVDIATLIGGGGGGGGFGGFLGKDTTISYRFLSGTEKTEIAIATMSNDLSEVQTVRYKNNQTTTAAPDLEAPGGANIQAFPNPAVEWVRFDCTNLQPGDYTLKIFNVIGKTVWRESYSISGSRSIRIDLDSFKKGTYLYSLVDSKGNIIGTKRLVVLKP